MDSHKIEKKEVSEAKKTIDKLKEEVSKVIVGQNIVVDSLIRALLANGHVLLEGLPGIAKTMTIRALAKATGCKFSRIQFTIDLLPTDIIGLTTYDPKRGFKVEKGPVFANFIIADEINRSSPKTQSALLEAMQEKQVTIGKNTHNLELPFFVMATQNPIESSGVYPLPEAQVDRFLFKVYMDFPSEEEEVQVLNQNVTLNKFEDFKVKEVLNPKKIIEMQNMVRKIYLAKEMEKYIVRVVNATRQKITRLGKYIEYGASPRASIGIFIAAKAQALMEGDTYVTPKHVKRVAYDVMRHRILLNYEGQAEGVKTDDVIREVLSKVPIP